MSNQKHGNSSAGIAIVRNFLSSNQADILHQTYAGIILREEIKYFVTHVMVVGQHTLAVDAAIPVIAKISRRQISSKIASAEHSNASSASQDDERARYALWTCARNSSEKRAYRTHTRTNRVALLSVTIVHKKDTQRRIQRHIPVVPARRSLEAMVCFKVKTSSEPRRAERKSAKVAFSDELDGE